MASKPDTKTLTAIARAQGRAAAKQFGARAKGAQKFESMADAPYKPRNKRPSAFKLRSRKDGE